MSIDNSYHKIIAIECVINVKFNGKEVEMRKPIKMNPARWKAMYEKKEGQVFPQE